MKPPHTRTLRVGGRSSDLAMIQTQSIIAALQAHWPSLHMIICPIPTLGDANQNQPIAALSQEGGEGVFNKALEQALLNDEVDVVTASFKRCGKRFGCWGDVLVRGTAPRPERCIGKQARHDA